MHNRFDIHPGIKLRHIRAFLDIASEGGMSAVARRHGVTQPALSRSLAELEAMLGQALFLRQGRRLILTEAGMIFRRHAGEAVLSLQAAAAALSPEQGGVLRLGVLPTAATSFLPALALRFRAHRPQTLLTVETGPHHYMIRLLREGHIDLMLGRLPRAAEMAGLSFEHLFEEDIILVARPGNPLLRLPAAEALAKAEVILPPKTALIAGGVTDYLASIGLAGKTAMLETASLALGRGICRRSDVLWFISRSVVEHELQTGALMELPIGAPFLTGAVGITRQKTLSVEGLATFEDLARALAADWPPGAA